VLILRNRNAGAKIWFIDISPSLLWFFRLGVAARCQNLSVCRASEHLLAGKGSRASCLISRGVVSLNLRVSFRALSSLVIGAITSLVMNKIEAAKELKISVRSLQRLAQSGVLKVVYKRGDSGKQEAVFDADDIAKYKIERDKPVDKLVPVPAMTKNDLARSNTLEFLDVFKNALTSQKSVVPIADKILLAVQDCRLLTGLSEKRIIEAIKSEKLKAKFIGKGWKIKRGDLNNFIDDL
jgi:hypothetical protein